MHITKRITFVDETEISPEHWLFAFSVLEKGDLKDAPFVALSHSLNANLWTGDKKLHDALMKMNYNKVVTTSVIMNIFDAK